MFVQTAMGTSTYAIRRGKIGVELIELCQRAVAMREPRGQELIERYKKNYNIPDSFEITELMVLKYWELESP